MIFNVDKNIRLTDGNKRASVSVEILLEGVVFDTVKLAELAERMEDAARGYMFPDKGKDGVSCKPKE